MGFLIFTELCKHDHYPIVKHFHYPKSLCTYQLLLIFPLLPSSATTDLLSVFICCGHFRQESYIQPLMIGFVHQYMFSRFIYLRGSRYWYFIHFCCQLIFFCITLRHFINSSFDGHLSWHEVLSPVILICISLVTNGVEHLFMCSLEISLMNNVYSLFVFLLTFKSSLYFPDKGPS